MPCPYHPSSFDDLIMLGEEYKSWSSSFYLFSSLSVFCTVRMENFYHCHWPWHMTRFIPVDIMISKRMSGAHRRLFAWSVGFPAWLRFFCAFSSFVRQMPGYTSQRRGKVCTLPN
jgi:hypothetical protein